jgi:uncharacterized protein YndB with AHSA1/START domain
MPTLNGAVVVQRPQQEVFDYIARVGRHGEWSPKAWRVEGDPGTLSMGTKFTSYGWIPGDKEHKNEVEVTECAPPSRISWKAHEKGEPFMSTFVLSPEGSGTKIDRTFEFPQPKGFVGVMFPLIRAALIKPNFNKGLAMMKQRLESGSGGPSAA